MDRCHICGSTNFTADRALAGRIICSVCSTPFSKRRSKLQFSIINKVWLGKRYRSFILIFIGTILGLLFLYYIQ